MSGPAYFNKVLNRLLLPGGAVVKASKILKQRRLDRIPFTAITKILIQEARV